MGDVALDSGWARLWLERYAARISEQASYLTELDSAIGDADHGTNMDRGFKAVAETVLPQAGDDAGALLKKAGMTLLSKVGGASGPLYGTLLMKLGAPLDGKTGTTLEELAAALSEATQAVRQRGRAAPGEKTMIDALEPAVEALQGALGEHASPPAALAAAADAAERGAEATIPMKALKGRASYLGDRSIGHQDPGATSTAYLLRALAESQEGRAG
jgi:phosphoenolpyruvate---glycerone phosphotransferase subunit DhaL